jgi:hypothetical protein
VADLNFAMEELVPLYKTLAERVAAERKIYDHELAKLNRHYEETLALKRIAHNTRTLDIQKSCASIDARLHKWFAETTFETFFNGTCIAGMLENWVFNMRCNYACYAFKNGARVTISWDHVPEFYDSDAYHFHPTVLPLHESEQNAFLNLPFVMLLLLYTHAWLHKQERCV